MFPISLVASHKDNKDRSGYLGILNRNDIESRNVWKNKYYGRVEKRSI
jgi:hypothetical protein